MSTPSRLKVAQDEARRVGIDHLAAEHLAACDKLKALRKEHDINNDRLGRAIIERDRLRTKVATLEGVIDIIRAERNQAQDQRDRLMINPGR